MQAEIYATTIDLILIDGKWVKFQQYYSITTHMRNGISDWAIGY